LGTKNSRENERKKQQLPVQLGTALALALGGVSHRPPAWRCRDKWVLACSAITPQVAASKPCSRPPARMRQPSFTIAYAVLQGSRQQQCS
jgi:hypothetical protein